MNKKQLAKLLIKHPEIKALYESREFDASIINKIVAEEIMREDEEEEGEGRVSKAANQARATLDAEDSVSNLDPSLSDAEIRKQFRAALESATTLEKIDALDKEASKILDPRYAKTLTKDIKAAKARIKGGSTNDSKEDPAKKKLIQSMKSEIQFLKTLLSDPNEMPLDKEEYEQAIDEYIEKLEEMGVEVAKTDSIEDDKAFVKSVADSKPEIEKEANAVKAAEEDDFAEKFSDLDAAIMAALKGSKDAATAANDQLDLSDIEIEDDADGSTDANVDGLNQESTEANREKIRKNVDRAINAITRSFTISDYPNDLSGFLDKEDVTPGGRNGDLIAVNIDQKSSKAILLCYLISRVAGGSDGNAIESFAKNGFPNMSKSPLGLTNLKYSEALSKLGLTTNDAKKIFKEAQMPLDSALKALMKSNQRGGKGKFKNEAHQKQMVMLPFVRKFINDSSISEIITSATSEPTQQGVTTPEPQATEEPSPQPPTKRGIKIAQGAIRGQDVNTSEVSPEEVNAAIEQDKEEISTDPEMRDNAEELVQQVQAKTGDETTITSEQPATEEGTAAAIEAIVGEVPAEVPDIAPADVEAAKEELKSEIKEDPEKQANAEELKNKVENNKMAPGKKMKALEGVAQINDAFKKAQADIKKRIAASASGDESDMDNLPTQEEILGGATQAMKTVLEKIKHSSSWDDLADAGIWPTAIKTRKDANQLPEFEKWRSTNLPKVQEKFKTLTDSLGTVDLSSDDDSSIANVQSTLADAAVTIGTAIQNNDATGDNSGGDSSGADIVDKTDLEAIEEMLPELKDKFPNLFKFDEFVKNLAQALMNTEPSNDSDGEEEGQVDATGTANSPDTNPDSNVSSDSTTDDIGGLGESLSGIYLTEETEVNDTQVDNTADDTTGQPVDVADATVLQSELEELRKILEPKKINIEDLLPQDLRDALAKAPETDVEVETKTAEQAAKDGNTASGIDARKEQASAIEIYSALIQPMDDFFSTDQAQRLGFMEQFLLESQSKMLWNLIGNLTLIAEKGKAKAFTNRAEKEAAGMSGDGAPEAEVEQTAEPEVQAEAQFNPFKRDKEPVEISKEDQISLKTDLKALLQTLRATKSMIGSYERNMTKVSVDPGLDGSALKEQLDQYLPMVQKSIAKIVERANEAFIKATELNAPKEEPEVSQPADATSPPPTPDAEPETTQEGMINAIFEAMQPALHEMSLMQEESRGETINRVDSVYKKMRLIYAPVGDGEDSEGLRGFMETGDRARTIQQAEEMLELATKEDFIKLFPGGRIGEGGMPATVNAATETMNREIKKLVLIMRDVVTLASKSVIPHSKLVEIVKSLSTISKSLYNSFGAKMMISGESLAQIETRLGEDENNKSLTDQETKPGMMDKPGTLTGKTGEQSQEEGGDEVSDEIDQSPDIPDEEKEGLKKSVEESKQWFDGLEDKNKSAIAEFVKQMISRGAKELQEMEVLPYKNEITPEIKASIASFAKKAKVFHKGFDKMIPIAIGDMDEDYLESTVTLMEKDADNFVAHLRTIFMLKDKLSLQTVMKFVQDLAGKAGDVASAALEPIKQKFKEISKPIENKLKSLTTQLVAIKNASKFITEVTAKHLWEMLTSFFKKNLKSVKSNKESEFKDAIDDPSNNNLSQEQQQSLEKSKSKLIDSYNKVSFPAKKWMDSLPGTLKSGFALFALHLIDLVEFLMKKVSAPLRPIALVMFLKFANPEKFESLEEKTVDELGISKAELISGNEKFVNSDATVPTQQKSNDGKVPASEKPKTDQEMEDFYNSSPGSPSRLEESLRPIIEKMLNEHYNY